KGSKFGSIQTHTFDFSVRCPFQSLDNRTESEVRCEPASAAFPNQRLDMPDGGTLKPNNLVEAPPESGIKGLLEVRRSDHQGSTTEAVEHLEESVHYTLQLAVFSGIVA